MGEDRLTIPGARTEIAVACAWVVRVATAAGLSVPQVNHCELALDEACTNIVEHAYEARGVRDGTIEIVCEDAERWFSITVIDSGPPFNPLLQPDPDRTLPLEQRAVGGWGLMFIRQCMDEVRYHYVGQHNHLVMVKLKG